MTPTITCFGETLWDVLPTSKQPGGAPLNVAASLRNFGLQSQLISRVGADELGTDLLTFIGEKGLPTQLIQVGQTHLTGVAKANISNTSEVTYKIAQPVAWDYIQLTPDLIDVVQHSDVFVYGSLAARSPQTLATLRALLDVAPRTVFDVNLRAPHYDRTTIETLLQAANIVKLNEHELAELAGWYGNRNNLYRAMLDLRERYDLTQLCVTLGGAGAVLLDQAGFYSQVGLRVDVVDTIGSGDAFLAAFLHKLLQGKQPNDILAFACATGAYVATRPGATPIFTEDTINALIVQQQAPTQVLN